MPISKLIQPTNLHDCEHACSQSFEVLISDVRNIIENGRKLAYDAVGKVSIATFWNVGKRIVEELQHGDARTDTDNTIARYSVLHNSEQIFAAKYMPYMPTEEDLRQEIEQQKQFFLEQHK